MSLMSDMVKASLMPALQGVNGQAVTYLPESGGTVPINALVNAQPFADAGQNERRKPPYDVEVSFSASEVPAIVEQADRIRLPGVLVRKPDAFVTLKVVQILSDPGSGRWKLGLR